MASSDNNPLAIQSLNEHKEINNIFIEHLHDPQALSSTHISTSPSSPSSSSASASASLNHKPQYQHCTPDSSITTTATPLGHTIPPMITSSRLRLRSEADFLHIRAHFIHRSQYAGPNFRASQYGTSPPRPHLINSTSSIATQGRGRRTQTLCSSITKSGALSDSTVGEHSIQLAISETDFLHIGGQFEDDEPRELTSPACCSQETLDAVDTDLIPTQLHATDGDYTARSTGRAKMQ